MLAGCSRASTSRQKDWRCGLPRGQSELQSASVEAEQAASVDVRWKPLTEHLAALQAALLLGDGAGANAALQDVAADCAPLAASWGGAE